MQTIEQCEDVSSTAALRRWIGSPLVFPPDPGEAPISTGPIFSVHDPATGNCVARVADQGQAQAVAAVDAAHRAQPGWAATAPRVRADVLMEAHRAMLNEIDQLATLISIENGKSLTDAQSEVVYAADFLRWYAEEGVRVAGTVGTAPSGAALTVVSHQPVGVAALIIPWNFPAAMATRKIAPALAAGCAAVLKPAAETPLTALAISRILTESGLPEGVLGVVPTTRASEVGEAWIADPRIRKLSFTGSTAVGRQLLAAAAHRVLNVSMELGGNAPFIVTADADVEQAVEGALIAKFRNSGQACTAANRFYVNSRIHDEFVSRFTDASSQLTVGPAAAGADVGPLISARAVERLTASVDAVVRRGARLVWRADLPPSCAGGHFFPPTVIDGVPMSDPILSEELFGPVATVVKWDDLDDVVAEANRAELGLASYVYAAHRAEAVTLARRLECGMVGVHRGLVSDAAAPFGGMKQSGLGREGAREGLYEYLEPQYLSIG